MQKDNQHDYFPKLKETPGKAQANTIAAALYESTGKLHEVYLSYRTTAHLLSLMQEGTIPINPKFLELHETSLKILQQHLIPDELNILTIAITQADIDNSQ